MCFYTKQKEPIIASEDIKGYKILVKKGSSEFIPYFVMNPTIELDTVLINDSELCILGSAAMKERKVLSGVFHIFKNIDPIKMCLHRHDITNRLKDRIFVAEAIIPKGTTYFFGRSNSFTKEDETYASTKIIYKNPIQIDDFLKSFKEDTSISLC